MVQKRLEFERDDIKYLKFQRPCDFIDKPKLGKQNPTFCLLFLFLRMQTLLHETHSEEPTLHSSNIEHCSVKVVINNVNRKAITMTRKILVVKEDDVIIYYLVCLTRKQLLVCLCVLLSRHKNQNDCWLRVFGFTTWAFPNPNFLLLLLDDWLESLLLFFPRRDFFSLDCPF